VLEARTSNISPIAALAGVRVGPGATVLTRTPWAAYSAVQA
jgi:hypothetical protein